MRYLRLAKLTSCLSFLLLGFLLQVCGQEINKPEANHQTTIRLNVTDKNKNFIKALGKEDIRVFEDGTLQSLLGLQEQSEAPLAIALLVDLSLSQARTLPIQKTVAYSFIHSVMHPLKDKMAVVSFTGRAKVDQDLTDNVAQLQRAIEQLKAVELPPEYYSQVARARPKPGSDLAAIGSTAIWDAIYYSCEEVLAKSPKEKQRAIILLTDGEDTSSQKQMKEAVEQAIKSRVTIFAIGIGDEEKFGVNRGSLRSVSEETGGRAFFPKNASELHTAFTEVEKELRENYLITYVPQTKKRGHSFHKVRLEIANPDLRKQDLRLNFCNRYFD